MKKLLVFLCTILLFFGVAGVASALDNGGFETGDLTYWTATVPAGGSAQVVTSHDSYGPVEGTYFAELKTDGPGSYTTLSQSVSLTSGDVLSGWAAFDYGDYHPYDDNAYVKIYNGDSLLATPWDEFGLDHPNYWDGPWTYWEWTSPTGGDYTLVYGVSNALDGINDSYALFDAPGVAPVPEPATMLLLGSGLIGLASLGRKKFFKK